MIKKQIGKLFKRGGKKGKKIEVWWAKKKGNEKQKTMILPLFQMRKIDGTKTPLEIYIILSSIDKSLYASSQVD